jgi:hypothetical protein
MQTQSPDEYQGSIRIVFPEPAETGMLHPIPGWSLRVTDAAGTPIPTVTHLTLYGAATDVLWAMLTVFTDLDGKPILDDSPVPLQEGPNGFAEPKVADFPFLVMGVSVEPLPGKVPSNQLELPFEEK